MGGCLTKSKDSKPQHYAYRSGAKTTPAAHQQVYQEPVRPAPAQPHFHHIPEKSGSQARRRPVPPASSIKPAPKVDTILGKPYEDIRMHYTFGKKLGKGRYGDTYLCTENSTREQYACKTISKRRLVERDDEEDVKREIQIMQHLSGQPNIVELKRAYDDKQSVHLVMELCAGGELFDRIIDKGRYSECEAAPICRAIVNVVHACHSMGVMHRDLKPENFLYSSYKDENALLKLSDFGLSVFIEKITRENLY